MANGASDTVHIVEWPKEPLSMNAAMDATLTVRGEVPVCIRVCEPICARSEYSIGITIFDRPVATISIAGETRIYNCDEKR